jgi:mono/diheme cytochrome c family protein
MKLVAAVLIVLVAVSASALIVIYSGMYNVGTNNHDNALINWVLDTAMTRSVQRQARGISVPPLSDSTLIDLGFREYRACAGCHGAPGKPPGPIAKGLWPEAPDLAKTADDWTAAQLYWIIKNGLKFTSMPAWGPTRDDQRLWALTAFVRKLPRMSASEYKAMTEEAGMESPGGQPPRMPGTLPIERPQRP